MAIDDRKPRNEMGYFSEKQARNRYSSAGITQREADTIERSIRKLTTISKKKNLYVMYERDLLKAVQILTELLEKSQRI
jgi:hypothetical protein|tara:strand:+ start:420 stop:656 length:237 start_codon:yes stop_codon:yes gene_type:complete